MREEPKPLDAAFASGKVRRDTSPGATWNLPPGAKFHAPEKFQHDGKFAYFEGYCDGVRLRDVLADNRVTKMLLVDPQYDELARLFNERAKVVKPRT